MKIIFFGSSHFAVPALEALIKSDDEVCCVVTQPDKKKGRHLHLDCTDVKVAAKQAGLEVFQPEDINSLKAQEYLKRYLSDLFVVVAYGQILSQEILDIPKIFALNLHASLLPKYRGAAPINWAIIHGEETTGLTIMRVIRKMDSGPILMQKKVAIGACDDSIILEDKLRRFGAELLLEALKEIKNSTYKLTDQDEKKAVFAPKLKKDDGYIDWARPAAEIYNLVRGSLPWPGAFTYYKGKLLKIYKVRCLEGFKPQGAFRSAEVAEVSKDEIIVLTGKGALAIEELQPEGARRLSAKEFIIGHKIKGRDVFGKK